MFDGTSPTFISQTLRDGTPQVQICFRGALWVYTIDSLEVYTSIESIVYTHSAVMSAVKFLPLSKPLYSLANHYILPSSHI